MERNTKKHLSTGLGLLLAFALWTVLILFVDVQKAGPSETEVGFATFNIWFHRLTGEHMTLYTITDWLGLVPIAVCLGFGALGLVQLFRRKGLQNVDPDILLLGGYYVLVILGYLFFEAVPINYRPVLIEGRLEASYPSSTTLLVLSVVDVFLVLFSSFMVIARLVSGVHWITDIIGAVLLSGGLLFIYQYGVEASDRRREKEHGIQ